LSSESDASPLHQLSSESSSPMTVPRKRRASSQKGPARRSGGSSKGQKKKNDQRQASKRQKVDGGAGKEKERGVSQVEVLEGLSASSSSSEDEFDRLVKNSL